MIDQSTPELDGIRWPQISLEAACSLITDGTHQTPTYADEGFVFLSSKNVTSGRIDWDNVKRIPEWLHAQLHCRLSPQKGDLLLAKNGTTGVAAIVDRDDVVFDIYVSLALLRPRPNVLPEYLHQVLNSPLAKEQFNGALKGIGVPNLHLKDIRRAVIPLPPLSEQKRIAEILDRAEALRAKRRAALALLDELTQSIFLDMFGDPAVNPHKFPTVQLSSLVRVNDRLNYGVVQPGDDVADGVPLVRVSDLTGGKVADSNLKRISKEIDSSYKRSRLNGDEVLISCVGTVGSIALVEESQKGFNIARAVARVPLVDTCNRVFIAEYLRSHHVQRYFTGELRTVSQPTLNIKQIGETGIQIPPIGMQNEFEIRKVQVDHLRQRQERAALVLDEYFSSLQQRAFRGDL